MKVILFVTVFIHTLFLAPVICAGEVVLPRTGQSTCWNADGDEISCYGIGQDGALEKGEIWPEPRFKKSGMTVYDALTGLHWTSYANALGPAVCGVGVRTWQEALDFVKCLNENRYLGYNDWRLPNINELESLVNYEVNYPEDSDDVLSLAEWLAADGQGFTGIRESDYWSSSSFAAYPGYAWGINMLAGYQQPIDKKQSFHVVPVRSDSYLIGDINDDKQVNMTDAVISLRILSRFKIGSNVPDYKSSGMDLGGNKRVGLEEVIYILQIIAGSR